MNQNLLNNLVDNLHTVDQIYRSAIYGASHKEVRILQILQIMGSKSASNQLSKEKFSNLLEKLDAMDSIEDEEQDNITIKLNQKELQALSMIMRSGLKSIREVPSLAREQAVISFTSYFEAYISDLLREIFDKNVDCLKSNKTTLKDEELIESLKTGSVLETLKEAKIRDLMYGSVKEWMFYFKSRLGFQTILSNDLIELYLVRNCFAHNGGKVSKQLESEITTGRYKLGTKIIVNERDYDRYQTTILQTSKDLWEEYVKKFN